MGRREQNKARKQAALYQEGLRLFVEKGYDQTSIEQIVAAAGVARGTFYLYHPNKLALFEALVDRWYQPTLDVLRSVDEQLATASTREDSLAIYGEMAMGLAGIGLSSRDEFLIAFAEARRPGEVGERLRQREIKLQDLITKLTTRARDRGLISVQDPRLAGLVIFGAVERLVYEALTGAPLPDTPLAVATSVLAFFGRALGLPVDAH